MIIEIVLIKVERSSKKSIFRRCDAYWVIMHSMYKKTHKQIQDWYHTYGRKDLPWRLTDDPYHIYLSA